MRKIKKIFVCLLLSLGILCITPVYAGGGDQIFGGGTSGPSLPIVGPSGPMPNNGETGDGGGSPYFLVEGPTGQYLVLSQVVGGNCSLTGSYCSPQAYIGPTEFNVAYNIFDLRNNSIFDENTQTEILAGTYIGARLYEQKQATWYAKGTIIENYSCWYDYICDYIGSNWSSADRDYQTYTPVYCRKYYSQTGYSWSAGCQEQADKKGYQMAVAEISKGHSYQVTLNDPNEARCLNPELYPDFDKTTCKNYEISTIKGNPTPYSTALNNGKTVTLNYYYEMPSTCVNVLTAKVRYLKNTNEKCDSKTEYEIKNDKENENTRHWHLFIPLNAKESQGYKVEFIPNTKIAKEKVQKNTEECITSIENYPNEYLNNIIPITGEFTGNIELDKNKIKESGGCYLKIVVDIPFTQKFYNEVYDETTNTSSLQGFEFYYRPIDINNPFPNGVTDDSYWKVWSESKKNLEELKNSYDEKTYTAYNIDAAKVRKYNDKELYTSWTNMNIDGTSNYIKNEGVITRISETIKNDIYKLGCGPSNKDQEECK